MYDSPSYRYKDKAKRPKVQAKQKVPRISLPGILYRSASGSINNISFNARVNSFHVL